MGLVLRDIDLEKVYISPLNVRKDPGDLSEITDSVKDVGVLEPILVRQRGDMAEVIAGSRRVKAARQAGHMTIPAIVLEVTDLEAILTSLTENIQRKDLSLEERVETYQQLQALEPEYRSQRSLAKAIGQSHQKINQDFQAYEILEKLRPHGIRLASDLPPTSDERQQGTVLPEYHAVLVHQAMSYLEAEGAVTEAETDEKMAELARLIAPMSQADAKALIEAVKAGEWPGHHSPQYGAGAHAPLPVFQGSPARRIPAQKLLTQAARKWWPGNLFLL
jgi:ParB/RepB/Spo0J family partition protein